MSLELGRHVHKSYKQNSDHFLYVLQGIWIPANPLAHRGILVSFKGNIVDLLGVPMALHTREVPVQLRLMRVRQHCLQPGATVGPSRVN